MGITARFTLEDQRRFAELSGDYNPIHMDVTAARRTMLGAPVVHGVHLSLWALDRGLAPGRARCLTAVRAMFAEPTYLGTEVTVQAEDATRLTVRSNGDVACTLTLAFGEPVAPLPEPESATWPSEMPVEVARDQLADQQGSLPLRLDRRLASDLFPRLASELPNLTLAELLATTRLVGMQCPGLHSLFTGFRLVRRSPSDPTSTDLTFAVDRVNLKYSLLSLNVRGPSIEGTLETVIRPAPRQALSMAAVAGRVAQGEFAGIDALVVGGTRGIGEAIAKAIAAGGGRIVLTYHRGGEEAARVVKDIQNLSDSAAALPFNVLAPVDLETIWPVSWRPRFVFYLATPFIRVQRNKVFDAAAFERFSRYYVTGLHHTIEACRALVDGPLVVWSPSTVYLSDNVAGTSAYCVAKAAMEELGRRLSTTPGLRVLTPRLERTQTDQTASLMGDSSADVLSVALEELRALTS